MSDFAEQARREGAEVGKRMGRAIGEAISDAITNSRPSVSGALSPKEQALVDAALLWALCPDAGGYMDGPSIEDTCEGLTAAVEAYLGVRVLPNSRRSKGGAWWSVAQTMKWVRKCLSQPTGVKP